MRCAVSCVICVQYLHPTSVKSSGNPKSEGTFEVKKSRSQGLVIFTPDMYGTSE